MQIVNLSEAAILFIAEAATRADNEGKRMRLSFGQTNGVNSVAYKVGEGMWSSPFYDQPDPYRDQEPTPEPVCGDFCAGDRVRVSDPFENGWEGTVLAEVPDNGDDVLVRIDTPTPVYNGHLELSYTRDMLTKI